MTEISIIIVTYNHQKEIEPCLKSLPLALLDFRSKIIIIDNNSSDKTVLYTNTIMQKFNNKHQWQIIQNNVNLGFTKAINQGLRAIDSEFVLILNPDTELTATVLSELINKIKSNPEIGIVAPQLINPDGSIQPSCRRFPRHRDLIFEALGLSRLLAKSRIFNYWKMGDFDHQNERYVDQPQGACLLTHQKAIKNVGLLDEQFPMFFSDVDWCRRFVQYNWKILYVPSVKVLHNKGTSIYRNRLKMFWTSHRSFYFYFRKYYRGSWWTILNYLTAELLILIALLRALFYLIVQHQSQGFLKNS